MLDGLISISGFHDPGHAAGADRAYIHASTPLTAEGESMGTSLIHHWLRQAEKETFRMSASSRAVRFVALMVSCIALAGFTANRAMASTAYGDLNNFDVFNDTGTDCHGFEIELDDVHSTDITYTYDYNHYGVPTITEDNSDPAHPKVFVRYAATFNAATNGFSAFTAMPAAPPSPTDGHQCTN